MKTKGRKLLAALLVSSLTVASMPMNIMANETSNITNEVQDRTDIKVEDETNVTELKISDSMELYSNEKRYLEYDYSPSEADDNSDNIIWSVQDENIASIAPNGLLEVHDVGKTKVKISLKDDPTVFSKMKLSAGNEEVSEDYSDMSNRWLERIIGSKELDTTDIDINNYIREIEKEAEMLLADMNREESRTEIWDKISSDTQSANYTTQARKIRTLALSFGIAESKYYEDNEVYNDIIESINFLIDEKKYNGEFSTGNWWDWQIGVPLQLTDVLFIIQPYTDFNTMEKFVAPLNKYAEDPSKRWPDGAEHVGANVTDIALTVLGTGILTRDEDRINLAMKEVPEVMELVTKGDGLYKDGGMVQHEDIAYLGSYGNELIKGISRVMSVTAGTQWEMKDNRIENVYHTIAEGFIPLMHRGKMMSMVNGRSISRPPGVDPFTTELATGSETISSVLLISEFAPEEYQNQFKSAAKYWLDNSAELSKFFNNARDFGSLLLAKEIINNEKIVANPQYTGMKIFGSMDRAVQVNDKYTAGLSTYSSRVANYEFMNTENKKGWHTGSGMLYIYNNDLSQYGEGFWPTVDSYHLPGTTVDTKKLSDGEQKAKLSPESWVGGAANSDNGAYGMFYNSTNLGSDMDLKAQKSWFFLDNQIIALGTNINGTSEASIDTTVENREIRKNKSNEVTINDGVTESNQNILKNKNNENLELKSKSWIHLEGNTPDSDLAYYFPEGETIKAEKENRTGEYEDINSLFVNDKTYNKSFFKLIKEHGENVNKDNYNYVILPNKSTDEMLEYSKNNTLEILSNTEKVQAIRDGDTFAMNVWPVDGLEFEDYTVDNASSLIAEKTDSKIEINISDPRQQNKTINLKLNYDIIDVVSKDDSITQNNDGTFTVDVAGSAGASHQIVVQTSTEEDVEAADQVKEVKRAIYNLPRASELTLADKAKVEEVREMVNNLSDEDKEFVTTISQLEAREDRITELEVKRDATQVKRRIYNLPRASELTLKNKEAVEEVRVMYDDLSEEAKTLVTTISQLEAREDKLTELAN